jgi:hypothetical protein
MNPADSSSATTATNIDEFKFPTNRPLEDVIVASLN